LEQGNSSTTDDMIVFIQESLRRKRDIIIASESFGTRSAKAVAYLHTLLVGFEVKIVFVYRETLAHMISLYFQLNRYDHSEKKYVRPFSEFLLTQMDEGMNPILQPAATLQRYATVFGNASIHAIDMAGCEAAGIDLAYAVYCEIAGVLCDVKVQMEDYSSNGGYSLIATEVFSHFRALVETQNNYQCRFCATPVDECKHFEAQLRVATKNSPLPTLSSRLSMLVPFSRQVDQSFRNMFGDRILHGNQTANFAAMEKEVQVEQLDSAKFTMDAAWIKWLRGLYEADLAEGRLCGCRPKPAEG
jgi:hypothetical protein